MGLKRNIILVTLLILVVAIISYQILDSPVENKEQEDLDSKLKNELQHSNYLSDIIIEESKKMREQENSFDLMKKPLVDFGQIKDEPEFKLNYQHLKLQIDNKNDTVNLKKQSKDTTENEKMSSDTHKDNSKDIDFAEGDIFLGIKDGYVVIYKGDILGQKKLLEKSDILVKDLAKEDVKKLQLGIKIASKKELLSLLEGFSSAKN